jgi:flagellar FliJ protein
MTKKGVNMPRFEFKFQPILNIKSYRENILQENLANLRRKYQSEEHKLWQLEEKTEEYMFKLREVQTGVTSIEEILAYHNYLLRLGEDINAQKKRLDELSKEIDKALSELVKASQEKRIFEKLKERKLQAFQTEMEKQDQEFMDEIAANIYERKRNNRKYNVRY